jgi:hypothetical protein
MSKLPANKKRLTQRTLSFGNNLGLGLGDPVGDSLLQAAVSTARAAAAAAEHAKDSVQAAAQAVTDSAVKKEPKQAARFSFDPARPVRVTFAPGFMRIRVELTTRRPIELKQQQRANFSDEEKISLLRQTGHLAPGKAAAQIRSVKGFEKVDGCAVGRWRRAFASELADVAPAEPAGSSKKSKKRKRRGGGRPVNTEFEAAVRDQLIYSELEEVDGREKAVVKANVAYGYAIIRRAAQIVQKAETFASVKQVQKLSFSDKWIGGWIHRQRMRRRRITATEKVLPEPSVVQTRMEEIQKTITNGPADGSGPFTKAETISADETGVFFGAAPKSQVVPEDAARATAPESNEKARFTSLLAGTGEGEMLPSWDVIKCSVKGHDLSSVRVLKAMFESEPGFMAADGWQLKMWEKTLTLTVKGKQITATHKRPYLIHKESLTVVTVQHKAWMDTAGMVMWGEARTRRMR